MEKKHTGGRANKTESKEIVPLKRKESQSKRELVPFEYYDPWHDMDRTFERFMTGSAFPPWPMPAFPRMRFPRIPSIETVAPNVDLEDRGKDFLLTAELPGFKKEDVDVQISEDSVEIKAMSEWKRDDKTKSYVRKERGSKSFYRIIPLPERVKTEASEANLKDGVLEVVLPKKTPKTKKKITVK
jgi:HSP20 family protein